MKKKTWIIMNVIRDITISERRSRVWFVRGGGCDFQECIINFPCQSLYPRRSCLPCPFLLFSIGPFSANPPTLRQYCWPFRSTALQRLFRRFCLYLFPFDTETPQQERGNFRTRQSAQNRPSTYQPVNISLCN